MHNRECFIVRDLMPLYAEDMVSTETADFVREHLEHCPQCASELAGLAHGSAPSVTHELPLRNIRRKLMRKRLQMLLLGLVLAAMMLLCLYGALDAPDYFPYSEGIIELETEGGDLIISFAPEVTDFSVSNGSEPDSGSAVYTIEAWSSRWDALQPHSGCAVTRIPGGADSIVFYAQNNGQEDVCIHGGGKLNGGRETLPALRLGYYAAGMAMLLALLLFLRFLLRRSRAAGALELAALYPLSYLLSHPALGIGSVSYSFSRDFGLLLCVSVLIFIALALLREIARYAKMK